MTTTLYSLVPPKPKEPRRFQESIVQAGSENRKKRASNHVQARVSTSDGGFSLPGVPLDWGDNALNVTVRDVSGNSSQQTRNVYKAITGASETFRYDGNGNLTNWISGTTNWVYEWDWADRMTKVTSNGVVVLENYYDAGSHRIAKAEVVGSSITRFVYLYDGWDIVGISLAGSGLYETYTRGVSLAGDIGGIVGIARHAFNQKYYVHNNHRGDVIMARVNALTLNTYRYTAFGQMVGTTAGVSRFKFSSKERDASTGMLYYGYRFYAPQWQRWVSADPIAGSAIGPATLMNPWEDEVNVHAFVGNDPILRKDAYGLQFGPGNGDGQCDVDKCKERCHKWADKLAKQGGFNSAKALQNCFEGCDRDANYIPGSPLPPLPVTKPSPKEPLWPIIKSCAKILWEYCKGGNKEKRDKK